MPRGEDRLQVLFIAKGGGSANKTFLYQGTPALLTHDRLVAFRQGEDPDARNGGLPAYHLAVVIVAPPPK